VKKSDIINFEQYLDSYIRFLKKFNENSWAEVEMQNSTELVDRNDFGFNKTISNSNHSVVLNYTSDEKINSISLNNNVTQEAHGVHIVELNKTYLNNTVELQFNQTLQNIITETRLIANQTKSFEPFNNTTNSSILVNNHTEIIAQNNLTLIAIIPVLNTTISETLTGTGVNITLNGTLTNETFTEENFNKTTHFTKTKPKKQKKNISLKSVKVEEKQNQTLNTTKKDSIELEEYESLEIGIYKRIINITLSLIVIGLLMGVLLGLILVMYLNSKNK
jgi:hypothetical protein